MPHGSLSVSSPAARAASTNEAAARRARDLAARYAALEAADLLRVMIRDEFPGRIAVVSSFGAESAVLLDLVAGVDPATPVIFLETGKHFPETLAYRRELVRRLGLTDVRDVRPRTAEVTARDPDGRLWRCNPDLCCHIRKVLPLQRALAGFDAWITGRKRFQGFERAALATIEAMDGRIKINPLARWSPEQVAAAFERRGLPAHPLVDEGFPSIGCAPCTSPADIDADPRAGRWAGLDKRECGIHRAPWFQE